MPGLPLEFVVVGVPASVQSATWRKRGWKRQVEEHGRRAWGEDEQPLTGPVQFHMVFYFEGTLPRLDVDNMIKLTQDALNDIVYKDDSQLLRTASDVRDINAAYRCRGMGLATARGFIANEPFVVIRVMEPPDLEVLP